MLGVDEAGGGGDVRVDGAGGDGDVRFDDAVGDDVADGTCGSATRVDGVAAETIELSAAGELGPEAVVALQPAVSSSAAVSIAMADRRCCPVIRPACHAHRPPGSTLWLRRNTLVGS
jgi:hypothetical protein